MKKILQKLKTVPNWGSERGATAAEYIVLVAMMGLALILALNVFTGKMSTQFDNLANILFTTGSGGGSGASGGSGGTTPAR